MFLTLQIDEFHVGNHESMAMDEGEVHSCAKEHAFLPTIWGQFVPDSSKFRPTVFLVMTWPIHSKVEYSDKYAFRTHFRL